MIRDRPWLTRVVVLVLALLACHGGLTSGASQANAGRHLQPVVGSGYYSYDSPSASTTRRADAPTGALRVYDAFRNGSGRRTAATSSRLAARVEGAAPDVLRTRPKFRRGTVDDAWEDAPRGTTPGSRACATCGDEVYVPPRSGPATGHRPPAAVEPARAEYGTRSRFDATAGHRGVPARNEARVSVVQPAQGSRMTVMASDLVGHLESHLGAIDGAWSETADGELLAAKVLRFAGTPDRGLATFSTLGLSDRSLVMPSGRPVRQELVMCCEQRDEERVPGLLGALADEVVDRGRAVARGEVLGPAGPKVGVAIATSDPSSPPGKNA